jgi:CBS-domain-containing membrane protein
MKLITWIKSTPAGKLAWRLVVGFFGGIVTALGLLFIVTPGPGIAVLLVGLAILASEFAWAKRAVEKARQTATTASERAPFLKMKIIIPIGLAISVFAISYWIFEALK